jgi:hypothetical protein
VLKAHWWCEAAKVLAVRGGAVVSNGLAANKLLQGAPWWCLVKSDLR